MGASMTITLGIGQSYDTSDTTNNKKPTPHPPTPPTQKK